MEMENHNGRLDSWIIGLLGVRKLQTHSSTNPFSHRLESAGLMIPNLQPTTFNWKL
jgi:hypothetical protein